VSAAASQACPLQQSGAEAKAMSHRILLVDDDPLVLTCCARLLQKWGYDVQAESDPKRAIDRLALEPFDAVLTDYQMPVLTGIDVLRATRQHQPACPTILFTGYPDVERAVEAMRLGAFNFLAKPFENEKLRSVVDSAVRRQRSGGPEPWYAASMILGNAPATRELRRLIADVADTDSTVLILGESGTGKELVARALHEGSRRRERPFVPVHCGAIPEPLLESEMFGHVKGAFTGATQARTGRFEVADRGTLFLDEVGDMPLSLQVKLLRVLQERCFEPVGGNQTKRVDVRVVAATNRDLEALIEEGEFRADLFYRLHVVPVHVPPLRERLDDLPVLARHFVARYNEARGANVQGITDEALACLRAYPWPGNVRELENLIERLVVLKRARWIEVQDLPSRYRGGDRAPRASVQPPVAELGPNGIDLRATLAEYEERLIRQALQRCGGNKNQAARLLGLNRTTLVEKLKRIEERGQSAGGPRKPVDAGLDFDGLASHEARSKDA
jgi:DNA-binding NtrC family response regulator